MFFFIGLSMAAVQGAYARRISPGGEITAVKRVQSSPGRGGGQGESRVPLESVGVGPDPAAPICRPSCCLCPPSSSSVGGSHCPCWAWGCCSTPSVSGHLVRGPGWTRVEARGQASRVTAPLASPVG